MIIREKYIWLEAHSGLSHHYITPAASTTPVGTTSSLKTNTTSLSSSSKR